MDNSPAADGFDLQLNRTGISYEGFRLENQIRRAVVSVMSNIAEGFESQTRAQFIRFLGHVITSAGEVHSQLYITLNIGYLTKEKFEQAFELSNKVIRQI